MTTPASNNADEDDEEETCPLCLDVLPKLSWRGTERTRLLCCGKYICAVCAKLLPESHQNNAMAEMASRGIPETNAELLDRIKGKEECPFCRTKLPRNDADRFRLVSGNAKLGKPWALQKLGMYHRDGVGTKKNEKVAFEYFRKGAEAGYREAQHELGESYAIGRGTTKNVAEAARWFERSAASGLALSQYQLGCILSGTLGASSVRLDYKRAFKLFLAAAEQGFHYAQCSVSYAYENGQGVQPSLERAIFWNRKAAMQDNVTAQGNLAGNYLHQAAIANGGHADAAGPLALFWAKKAAAAGDRDAARLALQLESGSSHKCALCARPEAPSVRLSRCARCKVLKYCSVEHQKKHWKVHKPWCEQVKAAEEEYNALHTKPEESVETLLTAFGRLHVTTDATS